MSKSIPSVNERFSKENMSAYEAQKLAHLISQGPVVFQAVRVMLRTGILKSLSDSADGMGIDELSSASGISRYGVQVLLESAMTVGAVLFRDGKYFCSKVGWFLLNDEMVKVNMDFNNDVNYIGMFSMEEAIREGRPAGLEHFGKWNTIYEALSSLPEDVRRSWFAFDHYYSDNSFEEALKIVFSTPGKKILDVGGNTGRFALKAVGYDDEARVTIMDLPGQIGMMKKAVAGQHGAERISAIERNLLIDMSDFPEGFDKIWMSQFLDCFSEEQVVSILKRAAGGMDESSRLYIMESFWDRQVYDTACMALAQISLYFTVMANGNSKMYRSDDMLRCVEAAGLHVEETVDCVGKCHTILICRKAGI